MQPIGETVNMEWSCEVDSRERGGGGGKYGMVLGIQNKIAFDRNMVAVCADTATSSGCTKDSIHPAMYVLTAYQLFPWLML